MTGLARAIAIGAVAVGGVAAIAAGIYFVSSRPTAPVPGVTQTADFTKGAYDANGNVLTGPVGVGTVINYVLSYAPPATGSSGPATITDTLSPNQQYVAGSIVAPGWSPSTPEYNGNVETYSSTGIGPGTGFALNVPPPSGGLGTSTGATGDGFTPIPVAASGRVYGIWHHKPDGYGGPGIMCWALSDLQQCSSFPHFFGGQVLITSHQPHAVVVGSKIYFAAGQEQTNNTTADIGIGCWDTSTESLCAFITLPGGPSVAWAPTQYGGNLSAYIAGLAADPANPTHLIVNANQQIFCMDVSGLPTACPGWSSPPLAGSPNSLDIRDMVAEDGASATRVFVQYNGSTGSPVVACRILNGTTPGANCPGWPTVGGSTEISPTAPSSKYVSLSLVPDSSSPYAPVAVCDQQQITGAPYCANVTNGSVYPPLPPALTTPEIVTALHIPGTAQVLYPFYTTHSAPYCFDFATSTPCAVLAPVWNSDTTPNSVLNDTRDYGYAIDPTDPEHCLLGLGDAEKVWRFGRDGKIGIGVCGTLQTLHATFDINTYFCGKKPTQATWTNVEIVGMPPQLTGGTIVIKDSANNVIQTFNVIAGQPLYTLNVPAMAAASAVTVEFTPTYTGPVPTATYQIKLNYTADQNPQICYKATVTNCGDVSNTATLKDDLESKDATVDLGPSFGGTCGPPPCLQLKSSVVVNADGTATVTVTGSGPPGFHGKLVTVQATTPGVTVQPPSRWFPSGTINGTWTVSGLTPGQTVTLNVTATDPGAGKRGAGKCCSSTIQITVPVKIGTQTPQTIDLGLTKTGVPQQGDSDDGLPPKQTGYVFTLQATNIGSPFNGTNVVEVTDVVPAGMQFASASGANWDCGPASQYPIAAGGTLACKYTGTAQLATGAPLPPISVNATLTSQTDGYQFNNCAQVGVLGNGFVDSNSDNNRSCYSGGTTKPAQPAKPSQSSVQVKKKKIGDPKHCTAGGDCRFAITVEVHNDGETPIQVLLGDGLVNGAGTALPGTITSASPHLCTARESVSSVYCLRSYPSGDTTLNYTVSTDDLTPGQRYQNCFIGKLWTAALPRSFSGAYANGGLPARTNLGRRLVANGDCYPFTVTAQQQIQVPVHVACPRGEVLDPKTGHCTIVQHQICDENSTTEQNGSCVCRWQGMTQTSSTACVCPQGATLDPERGCVPICQAPMVLNRKGTTCVCPQGTQLKDGVCQKKSSFLDQFLNNVHVGVGTGSQHGSPKNPPKTQPENGQPPR